MKIFLSSKLQIKFSKYTVQNIIYKIYKRRTMKGAAVRQTPNTYIHI